MIEIKHAVMIGLLGRHADRFHEYHPSRSFEERLELVQQIPGVDGIEIVYPQDFQLGIEKTIDLVKGTGLEVSAVNLNVKGAAKWQVGSFTAPDPAIRADAVRDMKLAMDLAAELESFMVTCCPLIDGHNYAFQADYLKQWRWLEEGISEAAAYRADVKISLEYKLNESRNYVVLGDMGRALFLCERIGQPNVGVTMDVGHALIAKETPAEVMCLAAQAGRLFYVHINDNGREWDWDMLPGAVNFWDLLEMLYYMDRLDYRGWVSYDVNSRQSAPVETMGATVAIVKSAMKLVRCLGRDKLDEFIAQGNPAVAFQWLFEAMLK